MGKWLNKLERKFGRYAIKNLTNYLMVCYVIGYVISLILPELLNYLTLEPGLILQGQVWRLVSWVIMPQFIGINKIIYMLLMLLLYYQLGNTLENIWGAFRYNLYMISGFLFTIIGAFAVYFISGGAIGIGFLFSTYYVNMTIFLACAAIMPDLQLYLYGILPVKMKWLAYLDIALLAYDMIRGGIVIRICIIASFLNFIIFFLGSRGAQKYNPKQMARKRQFQKEVKRPQNAYAGGAKHRCAVCGRTELDDPELEFRYCSKCNGNYEYCQDHLFTHEHVK